MFRILINALLITAFACYPVCATYYNGSTWISDNCNYYNGSAWIACNKYYYTGSAWTEIESSGGSCDTVHVDNTDTITSLIASWSGIDDAHTGDTFSASASDTICAIEVYISAALGTRTVNLRIGSSADLTTYLGSGSIEVTSADDGTYVTIPLDSPVTGQTTYYWAVEPDGTTYGTRVSFGTIATTGRYRGSTWSLALNNNSKPAHRVYKQ